MSGGSVIFWSVAGGALVVHLIGRFKPYLYFINEWVYVKPLALNMPIIDQRKGFFGNEYLFANGDWYAESQLTVSEM